MRHLLDATKLTQRKNPLNTISFGMIGLIGEFMVAVDDSKDRTGKTDRQSQDIDRGDQFVLLKVAPGGYQVKSQHSAYGSKYTILVQSVIHGRSNDGPDHVLLSPFGAKDNANGIYN
jgi:hypothetical protein